MPYGTQVVTLVSLRETGTYDELNNPILAETTTNIPFCRHRPLTFSETAEQEIDIATEMWRSTIPIGEYSSSLRATVLGMKSNDVIRVDGQDYQIVGGVRHHVDMDGHPFKVTIVSKKHIG